MTYLTNTARGARGIRAKDGQLVMVEPGRTVNLDLDSQELEDALAGDFEKGKAADAEASASAEEGVAMTGEPQPGDPPVADEPENEPASRRRR